MKPEHQGQAFMAAVHEAVYIPGLGTGSRICCGCLASKLAALVDSTWPLDRLRASFAGFGPLRP
jgi:hypothetical protein